MNRVFHNYIDDFLIIFLDDLLIFSETEDEHLQHIELVLQKLQKHKLYVSPKKCAFMDNEVEFLGLIIGVFGIRIDNRKRKLFEIGKSL